MKKKQSEATKTLVNANSRRTKELVKKVKETIDKMVDDGIPLTVKRIALNAGCSTSFIYKNEQVQAYMKSKKQSPAVGKRTYTDLEAALMRIRELEEQNLLLTMENANLYKDNTFLLKKVIGTYQINTDRMILEMKVVKENAKKRQDGKQEKA